MLKNYRYVILACLFFLAWKFFLTGVLWIGRTSPPEADDSFIYAANIESVRRCPTLLFCSDTLYPLSSSLGFDRLIYRLSLGTFSRVVGLSSVDTYHISFYLGYLFLLPALVLLLKSLDSSNKLTAVSLIGLALYHGQGSYHGFYWVVPSFFSLALLFYFISAVISGRNSWKYSLLLIPIGVYTHLIFFYSLIAILPGIFVFDWFTSGKINKNLLIRVTISLLICVGSYFPTEIYLNKHNSQYSYGLINQISTNSVSIPIFLESSVDVLVTKSLFPGFNVVWESYFRFLTMHWSILVGFVICLYVLWHFKKFKLLGLYFSALIFTIVSTISTYGSRGLIVIWPLTYIVLAQGWWLAYQHVTLNKGFLNKVAKIFLGLIVAFAVTANLAYSYYSNVQKNMDNSWDVDPGLEAYVTKNVNKKTPVYYTGKILESYFGSNSLYKKVNRISEPHKSCIYFASSKGDSNFAGSDLDKIFSLAAGLLGFDRQILSEKVTPQSIPTGFVLNKQFGSISVYSNIDCTDNKVKI